MSVYDLVGMLILGFGLGYMLAAIIAIYTDDKPQAPVQNQDTEDQIAHAYDIGYRTCFVEQKLSVLNKIAYQQIDLLSQLDTPNKGSIHSKHKSTVHKQLQELESEKKELLESMLEKGYDAMLDIVINGTKQQKRISELLPMIAANEQETKTDSNITQKSHLKLMVDNGEYPHEQPTRISD